MKESKQTRRLFLKFLSAVPAGVWSLAKLGNAESASAASDPRVPVRSSPGDAKVVIATRSAAAEEAGKVKGAEVAGLLNDSVAALIGKSDAKSAWRSLFGPADTVGIKVNCLAGRGLSSHPELVAAIVDALAGAGVPREKIIVWDRTEHDLLSAGFDVSGLKGAKVLATDSAGIGYENSIEFSGQVGSCFSRILSRLCTAVINVPVLKDHDLAGVSLGMKNFYGAIHNPNKYHDNNCDPYVADLSAHPFIAKKLRLVVCDALKGQYHGGPAERPQWTWPAATLVVGSDPVAVDSAAHEMIERKRKQAGMQSLKEVGREPKYIRTASQLGLGVCDPAEISEIVVS